MKTTLNFFMKLLRRILKYLVTYQYISSLLRKEKVMVTSVYTCHQYHKTKDFDGAHYIKEWFITSFRLTFSY